MRARSACWPSSSLGTSAVLSIYPPLGRVRRRGGDGHRRRATRVLDRPVAECWRTCRRRRFTSAPLLDRRRAEPTGRVSRLADAADAALAPPVDAGADLLDMLYDTSWVWSRCDLLFLNTVEGPGGGATVLRLKHPLTGADTGNGLALTCDGNHRWCASTPPGHGARRGRGGGQPGLRRRPAAGARQLPELRQSRAPRDDVAALRGGRRHGRGLPGPVAPGGGRQRQPLQRESGPRHRPHADRRRRGDGRRPDNTPARGVPGRRDPAGGAGPEPDTLSGSQWACTARPPVGHAAGAGPGRPSGHLRAGPGLVADGLALGVHDAADGGLGLALAEMAGAERSELRRPPRRRPQPPLAVRRVAGPLRSSGRPGGPGRVQRRSRAARTPLSSATPAATALPSRGCSTSRWPMAWRRGGATCRSCSATARPKADQPPNLRRKALL